MGSCGIYIMAYTVKMVAVQTPEFVSFEMVKFLKWHPVNTE